MNEQCRPARTEPPPYLPAHKLPAWLSSEDVLAAIRDLAEAGADKAVCWDLSQAVNRLTDDAYNRGHV